ncbi:MAG: hypothetical protein GF320_17065 [Armatimonadia bacterium]|nr:hypothetical protein [Armatimonadia bacterium]
MLEIVSPQHHQVIQRDDSDVASLPIDLRGAPRDVTLELKHPNGEAVACQVELTSEGDRVHGVLSGVPTGGPYQLFVPTGEPGEWSIIDQIWVGDLWVLAGQSNMDGCGKLSGAEPPSDSVSAFYYDDCWDVARDPLCRYNEAADPVHWNAVEDREEVARWEHTMRTTGAGLGISFGKELVRRLDVPVGLIACSHGGTSLDQWDPGLLSEGGRSLYGSMIRRVRAVGGKVRGLLWYQGESDANPQAAPAYGEKLAHLIASLRSELDQPDLPVIYVQLGRFYEDPTPEAERCWHLVRQAQLQLEPKIAPAAMVAASDLSLDDKIHVDALGLRRLGLRMARAAHVVAYGAEDQGEIGPRPGAVEVSEDRRRVTVHFESVTGGLVGTLRVYGFVAKYEGDALLMEWCGVGDDGVSVMMGFAGPLPDGAELYYNYGLNPQGILLDEWDMPVPCFGPMKL